jgi:hypothetical protein
MGRLCRTSMRLLTYNLCCLTAPLLAETQSEDNPKLAFLLLSYSVRSAAESRVPDAFARVITVVEPDNID